MHVSVTKYNVDPSILYYISLYKLIKKNEVKTIKYIHNYEFTARSCYVVTLNSWRLQVHSQVCIFNTHSGAQ